MMGLDDYTENLEKNIYDGIDRAAYPRWEATEAGLEQQRRRRNKWYRRLWRWLGRMWRGAKAWVWQREEEL